MAFKVASSELLDGVKIGYKVQFGLRQAGMNSTVTSISPMQPNQVSLHGICARSYCIC